MEQICQNTMEKYECLKTYLRELKQVVVAYSSGVDSTFLLKVAHEVLGDSVLAVTASSHAFPEREYKEAVAFCKEENIKHMVVDTNELQLESFRSNPVNRCYICKKALFQTFASIAKEQGIEYVVEGSNMDDLGDYRPGLQAIEELDIKSPLRYAKLTKSEIRQLSELLGLSTYDKPSYACLASRFTYGEEITNEKLIMVEKAEQFLLEQGFLQVRVRIHGDMARIELLPQDIPRFIDEHLRKQVVDTMKEYGFSYVSMDLQGYRTGSMNETIRTE